MTMNDLTNLYQEVILDHCRHPRHFGKPEHYSHHAQGINPICGDEITIYLLIKDNQLQQCQFTGSGCAICISSCSLLCELVQRMDCQAVENLAKEFFDMTRLQQPASYPQLKKCQVFYNIKSYPMRIKCATLSWHTVLGAIHNVQENVSTE